MKYIFVLVIIILANKSTGLNQLSRPNVSLNTYTTLNWSSSPPTHKESLNTTLREKENKLYLENFVKEPMLSVKSSETCSLRQLEMYMNVPKCGRVLFNTSKCMGLCESGEMFLGFNKFKSSQCASCKITKYNITKIKAKCERDYSMKEFRIFVPTECLCLKS